jgi:hypothetical protein
MSCLFVTNKISCSVRVKLSYPAQWDIQYGRCIEAALMWLVIENVAQNIAKCLQNIRNIQVYSAVYIFIYFITMFKGTAVAQWLRYCATNRKVAGSIPDGVIGIFH